MRKTSLLLVLLTVASSFAARMTVNVYGKEEVRDLHENDEIGFSADGDTLYFYDYDELSGLPSDPSEEFYLGTINRITFDTVGGPLDNFVVNTNDTTQTLNFDEVEGIIFEPETVDTGDWDGDGLTNHQELIQYGTDPRKWDTDGDGFSDYDELAQFDPVTSALIFNPKIADLPEIELTINSYPDITYWYTDVHGSSQSRSVVTGEETSSSSTVSEVSSTTYSQEHGWEVSATYGIKTGFDGGSTYELTAGVHGAYTESNTTEYGTSRTVANTQSFEEARTYEAMNEIRYEKATLAFDVTIRNPGHLVYRVENLILNAYIRDGNSLSVVSNLDIGGGFPFILDATANRRSVTTDVSVETAEELFAVADHLICGLDGYAFSYTSAGGVTTDFTAASTNTAARCADVIVDFGIGNGRDPLFRKVATLTKYNPDHLFLEDMYNRVTIKDILTTMDLDYVIGNANSNDGLTELEGITVDPARNSYWYIIKQPYSADSADVWSVRHNSVNPETLTVNTRDIVHFVFSKDEDGDSVSNYMEELLGTSDTDTDSDDDNLSDFTEIDGFERGGETYQTNPANEDTDGDGETDDVDSDPTHRPVGSSAVLDSLVITSGSRVNLAYDEGSSPRTALDSAYHAVDFRLVTAEVPQSVSATLNGLALTVNEVTNENRIFEAAGTFNKVLNVMSVTVISEDEADTNTYTLDVYSPLINNTSMTVGNTVAYCWKQLQVQVNDAAQAANEARTSGIYLFGSTSLTHLNAFSPDDSTLTTYTTSGVYGSSNDIYLLADLPDNASSTHTDTDLRAGNTYHYTQVPYYQDPGTGRYWFAPKSTPESEITYHNRTEIEFWKYKIIDEADGAGSCEIWHQYYYRIDNGSKHVISEHRREGLDDGDIRKFWEDKQVITVRTGEQLKTYLTLYEDDAGTSGDDYIWTNHRTFGGSSGYTIDELAQIEGSSWRIGDGQQLKDWAATETDDATVRAYARLRVWFEK